jgi:hypothetical protein
MRKGPRRGKQKELIHIGLVLGRVVPDLARRYEEATGREAPKDVYELVRELSLRGRVAGKPKG